MKLFNVLHKLSKWDLTRFDRFLSSDCFNKRTDVRRLLKVWRANKDSRFPSKFYWTHVYPKQMFSTKQWNLLTSRLFKLLEEYLIHCELQKDETQKKFYLAKAYRKIQEKQLFINTIRFAEQALVEKNIFRSTDYLQEKYNLSFEKYDYILSTNRKEKTNLQDVSENLDSFFIAAKLRQACYALSREIINQEEYEIGLLDQVLIYIEEHPFYLNNPGIAIYYHCFRAISSNGTESYFLKLRETISRYQQFFPLNEMADIYTIAINYSIRKLNTGSPLFVREAYELYLLSLEQGCLLEDGIMLESTYSNIVFLATKLKKYKWARTFIEAYQEHLKPAYRKPLFHFSLGKLFYEQGQKKESLQELVQVESKASFLHLGARVLQLKIYYELKEFDPLGSLLVSLKAYLRRSKDLAYRKEHYKNIIVFTKQLLLLSTMTQKEKEAFRQQIKASAISSEKDWFLEQIA